MDSSLGPSGEMMLSFRWFSGFCGLGGCRRAAVSVVQGCFLMVMVVKHWAIEPTLVPRVMSLPRHRGSTTEPLLAPSPHFFGACEGQRFLAPL